MAISTVDIRAAREPDLGAPAPGVIVPVVGGVRPCRGSKSYDSASINSLVENSLSSRIANSSHIIALDRLTPTFPGFVWPSFWNCKQFAINAYSVAREKSEDRICCWIGLTR